MGEATYDFISDIVYNRYGVGACVDPASGNVYFQTSPGLLIGYDSDGNKLWERFMEEFARLTFPNGRTGGPCVDGHLVIIHAKLPIGANTAGPARDRFYAFDKNNGDLVWVSTPGITPKDSSFAPLVLKICLAGGEFFTAVLVVDM